MAGILLQVRSNGQIILPVSIQQQANLSEGDTLEVIVETDGVLRLIPKIVIDRSQTYFWTEQWQAGAREAEADLEAGRVHRFDDVDEAMTFLDSSE